MIRRPWRRQRGDAAEARVQTVLEDAGFRLLHRNWSCRLGELDLVMQRGDELAIVEVRQRSDSGFGSAIETVTAAKQRKVVAATRALLARSPELAALNIRFDVAGVDADGAVDWIQGAFDAH